MSIVPGTISGLVELRFARQLAKLLNTVRQRSFLPHSQSDELGTEKGTFSLQVPNCIGQWMLMT